jgi:iron(III) transport system permease protein
MVLRRITIPMLRPAILNAALLIFTVSLEQLGIPLFLGAQHDVNFVASYLYDTWSSSDVPDPASVSAGAVVLLLVATGLIVLRQRLLGAESRFVSARGSMTQCCCSAPVTARCPPGRRPPSPRSPSPRSRASGTSATRN